MLMDFKQTYFEIWQEIWNLHKKYAFLTKDDTAKWESLTADVDKIHQKYKGTPEEKFVEEMLRTVAAEIDRKAK